MSKILRKEIKQLVKEVYEENEIINNQPSTIQKDSCINLIFMLIKNSFYRDRVEKALQQLNFFEENGFKNGFKNGYTMESIKDALNNISESDINFIFDYLTK